MADTAFYTHGLFLKHKMGNNNPECPKRLEKIEELMLAAGTSQFVDQKTPPMVAVTDMLAAHDADYISYLSHNSPKEGLNTISVDTAMNPYTWEAAQYAAWMTFFQVNIRRFSAQSDRPDITRIGTIPADSAS